MRARSDREAAEHGPHTLKVWRGTVVGVFGRDVFVELGPRMQGVIAPSSASPRQESITSTTMSGRGPCAAGTGQARGQSSARASSSRRTRGSSGSRSRSDSGNSGTTDRRG